jgi:hypothetical protein
MTNTNAFYQNVTAAVAAMAVSGICILGTVGPVETSEAAQPVQLQTHQAVTTIINGQLA